jgi:adenosylhomocysteine nucleosidase
VSQHPLGVIAALPAEAASCGLQGTLWPLVCSGIGREAAARGAQQLIENGVAGLISWGTAGALAPDLKAGTLVLYMRCVDAVNGETFNTDLTLRTRIYECLRGIGPVVCDGLTSAEPIVSVPDKRALRAHFSCSAVDMESAAIARLARHHRLPFIAIRTIVDPADFALPASALVALEAPAPSTARFVGALMRKPWELGPLLQLAWWYRRAVGQLRAASALMGNADWPALNS